MKKLTYILIAILSIVTGLYVAALFLRSSDSNIQLTHMIGLHKTEIGRTYQNLYTSLLLVATLSATAVIGLNQFKRTSINILYITSICIIFLTAYPVIASLSSTASFYEYYFGELVTMLVLMGLIIQTTYQRKKETNNKGRSESEA